MRGSRGSRVGEAMVGKRKRAERLANERWHAGLNAEHDVVHPSFDFASISAARLGPEPCSPPEPAEAGPARRSMASPIKAARLPQHGQEQASVIDIETRLKAAEERLKRAADVSPR